MRHLCYFFLLLFCNPLLSEESISIRMDASASDISSFNNPLKGIQEFTVFLFPGRSAESEKPLFLQALEEIGRVKTFLMCKAPIDYEGMGTGMLLSLNSSELEILGTSNSPIVKISLVLHTNVEIVKTKHPYRAHIWETNVFVTKDNIAEGVQRILKPFVHYYKEANPKEKPIFYVYLSKSPTLG